jgi:hypothetical protein
MSSDLNALPASLSFANPDMTVWVPLPSLTHFTVSPCLAVTVAGVNMPMFLAASLVSMVIWTVAGAAEAGINCTAGASTNARVHSAIKTALFGSVFIPDEFSLWFL